MLNRVSLKIRPLDERLNSRLDHAWLRLKHSNEFVDIIT